MRRKILSLLLASVLSIGCLAGCGQKDAETGKKSEKKTENADSSATETEEIPLYNADGSLPLVNEPVTLKVLTMDPDWVPYDVAADSGLWAWLEEQTGIHLEIESYSKDELETKLPLIMATPDQMPDIFFRCNFTDADILQYGNSGQLLMLDDYIEEYGTNIKECFDTLDYAYGATASADGHIYSLPRFNATYSNCAYAMNSRFLENAGVEEVPTTLEELYDVFKAILENDGNGDGIIGNEICWTSKSGAGSMFKRYALSMVGVAVYWPFEGCIFDAKDDEVYFVPTSDEYKYALQWLHTFYDEGMLDQEIFSQTSEEYDAKVAADLVFMGENVDDPEAASYTGRSGYFYSEPLTSAVNDTPFYTIGASYASAMGAISAYTEYPEVCMLLMDYLFSEEASRVAVWGLEGVDYNVISEEPWVIEAVEDDWSLKYTPTPFYVSAWNRDEWAQPQQTTLTQQRQELLNEYGRLGWQDYIHFTQEESEEVNVISTDLGLYCDDYFVGFITGQYDLEKDWDAYVEECNSMKAEELTAVYQAAYDHFYGLN